VPKRPGSRHIWRMARYTIVLRAQRAILLALAACAVFGVWSAWDELPTRRAAGGRRAGYQGYRGLTLHRRGEFSR